MNKIQVSLFFVAAEIVKRLDLLLHVTEEKTLTQNCCEEIRIWDWKHIKIFFPFKVKSSKYSVNVTTVLLLI